MRVYLRRGLYFGDQCNYCAEVVFESKEEMFMEWPARLP